MQCLILPLWKGGEMISSVDGTKRYVCRIKVLMYKRYIDVPIDVSRYLIYTSHIDGTKTLHPRSLIVRPLNMVIGRHAFPIGAR